MQYIGWILIMCFCVMAIISRIHYSKYKGKVAFVLLPFYMVAETIYTFLNENNTAIVKQLSLRMRKLHVVSDRELGKLVHDRIISVTAKALGVLFFGTCITLVVCMSVVSSTFDEMSTIERMGYDGDTRKQTITLSYGDEIRKYELNVSQTIYSEEEFHAQAELAFAEAEKEIGTAADPDGLISTSIKLPQSGSNNLIRLSWSSDHPELLFSNGTLLSEELPVLPEPVVLTATASYEDYEISRTFVICVGKRSLSETEKKFEACFEKIKELEVEQRENKSLALPEEIEGVDVSTDRKDENLPVKVFFLWIIVCGVIIALSISRLHENVKNRDLLLQRDYPSFVNRLQLLLGTGMTAKQAFERLSRDEGICEAFTREIRYTLNEIGTGMNEGKAYERLGERLALPVYRRLMSHISQNLKLGTSKLSELMERELQDAQLAHREFVKKQGEEVSGKLLFPMTVLLFVTMLIVVCPAIMGM